jgi:hypothetical protein
MIKTNFYNSVNKDDLMKEDEMHTFQQEINFIMNSKNISCECSNVNENLVLSDEQNKIINSN